MNIDDIEARVLKLDPQSRARLARKLLDSLETLSAEENTQAWAEEAHRRDAELDVDSSEARSSQDVFRDARSRLV